MELQELRDLANAYKSNVSILRELMNQYYIDRRGLEIILEARENFVFGTTMSGSDSDRRRYPVGLTLSLKALAEAYVGLNRDPNLMEDFLAVFNEHIPKLAGELPGKSRSKNFPDSLLRFGLELYKRNLGDLERSL